MALNISLFYVPLPVFLIALILVVAAIIILTVLERRLRRQVIVKKEMEDTYYRRKLEAVKALRNEPPKFLAAIDDVAREFFDEKFNITGARYSDLIEKFRKEKNESAIKFGEVMQETLYSGEKLTNEKLDFLFSRMQQLVRESEKAQMEKYEAQVKMEAQRAQQIAQTKQPIPQPKVIEKPKVVEVKEEPKVVKPQIQMIKPVENKVGFWKRMFGGGQREVPISVAKPQNVNMNIVKFLVEGRKRGFNFDNLKERLLAGGFKEGDIETAIGYLNAAQKEKEIKRDLPSENRVSEQEGKRIFAGFMQPKNRELEVIKQEVGTTKTVEMKPQPLKVIPHTEEKIELKRKPKIYEGEEPKHYDRIGSIDDLERVKRKIKDAKQDLSKKGYGGAGLG